MGSELRSMLGGKPCDPQIRGAGSPDRTVVEATRSGLEEGKEDTDEKTDQNDAGEEPENAERTEPEDEDELLEWSALLTHGHQGILKPRLVSAGNPKTGRITPSISPITRATTAV